MRFIFNSKIKVVTSITLLTTLFINPAFAGWTKLAADNLATEFVNLETVKQNGNVVSMWNMSNFNEPQAVGNGRTYLSTRVLQEYDCLGKQKRIITLIHYQNPMGNGPLAFYDKTIGPWRVVPAGSLGNAHLRAACLTSMHATENKAPSPAEQY